MSPRFYGAKGGRTRRLWPGGETNLTPSPFPCREGEQPISPFLVRKGARGLALQTSPQSLSDTGRGAIDSPFPVGKGARG